MVASGTARTRVGCAIVSKTCVSGYIGNLHNASSIKYKEKYRMQGIPKSCITADSGPKSKV